MAEPDAVELRADVLSPLAREVALMNPGQAYTSLVPTGPGHGPARDKLSGVTAPQLLSSLPASLDDARAMLSGLWLLHDFLDESHTLSQKIQTPTGSFWHAIMHRREGDFSNSKYWYARCESHPVHSAMASRAAALVDPLPADKALLRLCRGGWDPDALVDLVSAVYDQPDDPRHALCIRLQQAEWKLLFDHCTRAAAGR